MVMIPNHDISEKLGESPRAHVFKAVSRSAPQVPLVLKVFKAITMSEHRKSHFRQRIEHLKILHDPAVITPSTFEVKSGTCYVTQPFFEGVTLDALAKQTPALTLKECLTIACKLAAALEKIHEAGLIHGGIKPHNVLVRRDTLDVRVVDFLSPLDVREVSHFIYDPAFIANTLAYTSPEQTGRINHRVDFRSDLYSLGVVLWELLTGRPPFRASDPLELIHCHLAEEPHNVHDVNPAVPLPVAQIVEKLMLKQPEKRYQSGSGACADFTRCLDEYAATGTVRPFPLGTRDRTHRIIFISKMVGRDDQAKTILDDYAQIARGAFRSVFISGLSGIGKTRLIQELQRPIVQTRGYFTSGKFDIYQKNIPYSSLIQAFKTLVRTFLTENDERMNTWRRRILDAVGNNGRVLTDVIPELVLLIGEQPEVKPLPPVESRNRFLDVFDRFLGCLASESSPLTLFIDDLQWCDLASFEFLTNLFKNHERHPYLLLLGAYRHNEVDASHPLTRLLGTIKEAELPLKEIRLGALEPEHTHEMISYILDSPPQQTRALAELLHQLTEGNPLFVSESLSYLHTENLLLLDDNLQWRWDLEKIGKSKMPSSVVALFGAKVQRLPAETIELLQYCACMGNTFSPDDLSLIRECTLLHVFETLKPALGQGLLIDAKNALQFIHDRVQEAVLNSIAPGKRKHIHAEVGTHLLSAVPEGTNLVTLDHLFAIASHVNLGRPEQLTRDEAVLLSHINYCAGEKALNALATEAANEYFRIAKDALPDDAWATQYERTFKIFQKAAKTELMCGHADISERLLNELLEHAKTDLDKAECLAEQTTSLSSIGNFIKAIETANRGLAYFEQALPAEDATANGKRHDLLARIDAEHADVWNTILHMPFTHDRKSKIELAFYSELIPDLYMSGLVPQLYLSAVQSTQHCLAGGMDESVIYSFSIMGLQLGEQDDFERAFKYEDLARELSARHPNTFGATRGINGVVWCNMHSRSHPADIVNYSLEGIHSGRNCGDLYNAGLCYGPLMWNQQVHGADFEAIERSARECLEFSQRFQLSFSVALAKAVQAGWVEPMKKGYHATTIDDLLRRWETDNHVAAAGSYFVHKALTHYYFGEHVQAGEAIERVRTYLTGLTDNVLKRQWFALQVLNALASFDEGRGHPSREALTAFIDPIIARLEKWAGLGPLLRPYLSLVYAERERVLGDPRHARSLYLDAIDVAARHDYTFLEGLLCERLGELLLAQQSRSCRLFFTDAARLFRRCHAERKELELIERRGEHLDDEPVEVQRDEPEANSGLVLPNLDVSYLVKSSLALSAEIELDALLRRIMTVVLEASGAQHGYLLIEKAGDLFVRAESHGPTRGFRALDQRLEESTEICRPLVRYVFRTRQKLMLANACAEGEFKDHAEVQALGLRSVLLLPILNQSHLVGLLFLENRLADGVFTAEKTQMTELLTLQAAISLENARLVDDMRRAEETVRETRNFLEHLLDDANAPIVVWDAHFRITRFNHAFERVTGRFLQEVLGQPLHELFSTDVRAEAMTQVRSSMERERKDPVEVTITGADGSPRTMLWNSAALLAPDGVTVVAYIAQGQDITERKRAEEKLQVLLKEIHHRVKNNLQVVSSLFSLQSEHVRDERALASLRESQDRITSMSLIHEELYNSRSLERIDFRSYIQQLTSSLLHSYGLDMSRPRLEVDVGDVSLGIDTAIPCGLIINELVSNALKYAFPNGRRGHIRIAMHAEGSRHCLRVSDDGVGLPSGFDLAGSRTLGLKLVTTLARQLRATTSVSGVGGTTFELAFTPKDEVPVPKSLA